MRVLPTALFALSALLSTGCSEIGNGTGQISQRIGEVVHDPASRELDLRKLTSFGWEYFFLFKAGTTREQICQFIHAKRTACGRVIRYPEVPPGYVALFFGLGGQLTHTELHDLNNGEFDITLGDDGFPKEKSVFIIRRSSTGNGQERVILEPRSS